MEDESTQQNTLNNSGNSTPKAQGQRAAPANPFAKSLARLNAETQPGLPSSGLEKRLSGAETKLGRPHYDVDDFKRLLLKGETNTPIPTAAVPPLVSFQGQHGVGDSSSNTDTSSISRQSIFEPLSNPLQESPRTSHESSPADEERQQLAGSPPSNLGKTKPAIPRPRHGKLVKANTPQTVSFEDPTLSFSDSMTLPIGLTQDLAGTPNNGSKPLPAPPVAIQNSVAANPNPEIHKRHSYSASTEVQGSPNSQKRNPPAPPLSRRHSLRPKPYVTSERSTPISEEGSSESFPISQSPPNTTSKVPPPPPPRRAGHVRGESPSSISTTASAVAVQPQPRDDDSSTKSARPQPPTPPNRSPSLSAVKRQSTQPFTGSPSMAPPPPPRRRGSSASSYSYNPSRLSGNGSTVATDRMRSDSNASSISQLHMSSPTQSSPESRDVLADLSALQREVDELRGKFAN